MKKSTGLMIIAIIAFSCKSEQSHLKSDLILANLKGNVWKIDRTIHDTQNKCACALKTECNESKYVYDSKGNLLKSYTLMRMVASMIVRNMFTTGRVCVLK